jgi:hypothetical protein
VGELWYVANVPCPWTSAEQLLLFATGGETARLGVRQTDREPVRRQRPYISCRARREEKETARCRIAVTSTIVRHPWRSKTRVVMIDSALGLDRRRAECMKRALSRGPEHSGGDCGLHSSESQKSVSLDSHKTVGAPARGRGRGAPARQSLNTSCSGSLPAFIQPASAVDPSTLSSVAYPGLPDLGTIPMH